MAHLSALLLTVASSASALLSTLQEVTNFGPNPTNTQMFVYKPPVLAKNPPLVVVVHWCSGTAQAIFSGSNWADWADKYGFVAIYPDAPASDGCWDVHSDETLKHDAGGDSLGIASQIRYAISTYGLDKNQVYVTGISSGAMMTNVLAGAYPDLFKAGVAYAGVPYACFAGPYAWNSDCSTGVLTKTAQQWGDLVRAGYPGYAGARPKLQLWHGTNDEALNYHNFGEAIKQWTNVFGLSVTPTTTSTNTPVSPWTKTTYGTAGQLEGYSGANITHSLPVYWDEAFKFFGFQNLQPVPTSSSVPSATSSGSGPCATAGIPVWGQCGGQGWTGATTCASCAKCVYVNQWYSQCQ